MRMPFGKHKGCAIRDIPLSYLQWLWENVELYDPLMSEVSGALGLGGRQREQQHGRPYDVLVGADVIKRIISPPFEKMASRRRGFHCGNAGH